MVKNLKLLILILIIFKGGYAFAQEIIIGPYLQKPSNDSLLVKWQTKTPSKTILEFTNDDENFYTFKNNELSSEHQIEIFKPKLGQSYKYSIFASEENELKILENQAGLEEFTFNLPEINNSFAQIWVLGDPGVRGDPKLGRKIHKSQLSVKKEFFEYLAEKEESQNLDFIIALGDNAYPRGTFTQYKDGFFDPYAEHLGSYPVYSVFGNHDGGIDKKGLGIKASARSYPEPHGIYYDLFSLPGKESYYSFDYKDTHFIFLDSFDSLWEDFNGNNLEQVWTSNSTEKNSMLEWLENDLKAQSQNWTVVSFHHPPFGQSEHPEEKQQDIWKAWTNAYIVPLLHQYDVDLILMGHIHNYQRSFPISIKRTHFDRSILKPNTRLKEEKKFFMEKFIKILDHLHLPHYSAIPSTREKENYTKSDDPIYVIMGSSGAAFKKLPKFDSPVFFRTKQEAGSTLLQITPSKLMFKFIDRTGDIVDSFNIQK